MVVSGGDAPGINATLAHYTARAAAHGDEVLGAVGGFAGAMAGNLVPLAAGSIAPWAGQGGAYLPSDRTPALAAEGAQRALLALLAEHRIDNLVLFGGDGTLRYVAPLLARWGVPCISVPTTIDNNVPGTEQSLGFDSACNYAYQAIDGVVATGHALPGRIFMVETLGGDTGFLALAVAQGAGAHAVLVPEFTYSDDALSARLVASVARYGYALLVLSEGVPAARALADDIPRWTQMRVRDTRLGHAQRGGRASHGDRVLAAQSAHLAYHALRDGLSAGTVVVRDGRVMMHPRTLEGLPAPAPDRALYERINGLDEGG